MRLRQIGDVVFTTPAVRAVRTKFPDASLAYLVEPAAAPVVASNPNLNEIIIAPRRRGFAGVVEDIGLARRLRRAGFDMVIDFHGGPRASWLSWASGAPVRIGYDVVGRGWMYTHRVPRPRELRARHSVENQWDLLGAIGIAPPDRATDPVEMPVDRRAADAVNARLQRARIGPEARVIVVHVSAGNPFRRWPLDAFGEVAAALVRSAGRHVIVTSGPSDEPAARQVIAHARSLLAEDERDRVADCGDFSLAELRALVDRAALYIGGDSGPLHIAATSRVPIVGLYGPTLPARSAPWRGPGPAAEAVDIDGLTCRPCDQRRCVPGDYRCLSWIQPRDVVTAAERALEGRAS